MQTLPKLIFATRFAQFKLCKFDFSPSQKRKLTKKIETNCNQTNLLSLHLWIVVASVGLLLLCCVYFFSGWHSVFTEHHTGPVGNKHTHIKSDQLS